MERLLLRNAMSAKWVIGSFVIGSLALQKVWFRNQLLHHEVFGVDGNGGYITLLTDEEMAREKYVNRRWHWKGLPRCLIAITNQQQS